MACGAPCDPGRGPAELGHDLMPGVQQTQAAAGPGPDQELRADPGPGQRPDHLVVQVHRPRQRVRLGMPFEHDHADPGVGQEQRCGGADRAGAYDDDRPGRLSCCGGGAHC